MGMTVPLEELPSTKREALASGVGYFMPVKPCRNGHLSPRIALPNRSWCTECRRQAAARGTRRYYARNAEKCREYGRESQARKRAAGNDWASGNPEAHAALKSAWKRKNLDKVRASAMRRKAAKLNAEPSWLTAEQKAQINAFYREAARLTALGERHEVDHIVPLQGKTVAGLHVPWNLRVIPAEMNNRRPRNWKPEMEAA